MARLIKIAIGVLLCMILALLIHKYFISGYTTSWKYDLPNNYVLEKVNGLKFITGYKDKNKTVIEQDDKKIGIEIYVAEFQYSENFIGLKCAVSNDDSIKVAFYIIDTINQNVYGPYDTNEKYLAVQKTIMNNEVFNDYISTLEIPEKSYK